MASAPTTCSRKSNAGRYNPFGGTYNPQSVIDAITTSLVRQGTSNLTSYDAQISGDLFDLPAGKVAMATGLEYREEAISDIPDEQFQRGLIFGTEAVSAEASRDSWSAFVEFSVPVLETLEVNCRCALRRLQRLRRHDQPEGRRALGADRDAGVPRVVGHGFPGAVARADRPRPLAGVAVLRRHLRLRRQPGLLRGDRLQHHVRGQSGPPGRGIGDLQPRRGVEADRLVAVRGRLLGHQAGQQDRRGQLRLPVLQQFCSVQDSTVCVRGTPLPGDTLGPLQSVNSSFINIGEQSTNGVDVSVHFRDSVMGGELFVGLDYSRMLEFKKRELSADGTSFVTRDLTGEYEYPEDRFVLTGDWGFDAWGVRRHAELHRLVRGHAGHRLRRRARLRLERVPHRRFLHDARPAGSLHRASTA